MAVFPTPMKSHQNKVYAQKVKSKQYVCEDAMNYIILLNLTKQ